MSGAVISANTTIKIDSPVNLAGATTATLTVASGKIFKGTISCYETLGSPEGLVLRQTNSGGNRLCSVALIAAGATKVATQLIELGAGTYYLSVEGSPLNQTVSIQGNIYINSP